MVVSSTNKIALEMFKLKGMSFEYIMKRRGPSTDPCGTPQVIPLVSEQQFV
jgi:hypothetical protein